MSQAPQESQMYEYEFITDDQFRSIYNTKLKVNILKRTDSSGNSTEIYIDPKTGKYEEYKADPEYEVNGTNKVKMFFPKVSIPDSDISICYDSNGSRFITDSGEHIVKCYGMYFIKHDNNRYSRFPDQRMQELYYLINGCEPGETLSIIPIIEHDFVQSVPLKEEMIIRALKNKVINELMHMSYEQCNTRFIKGSKLCSNNKHIVMLEYFDTVENITFDESFSNFIRIDIKRKYLLEKGVIDRDDPTSDDFLIKFADNPSDADIERYNEDRKDRIAKREEDRIDRMRRNEERMKEHRKKEEQQRKLEEFRVKNSEQYLSSFSYSDHRLEQCRQVIQANEHSLAKLFIIINNDKIYCQGNQYIIFDKNSNDWIYIGDKELPYYIKMSLSQFMTLYVEHLNEYTDTQLCMDRPSFIYTSKIFNIEYPPEGQELDQDTLKRIFNFEYWEDAVKWYNESEYNFEFVQDSGVQLMCTGPLNNGSKYKQLYAKNPILAKIYMEHAIYLRYRNVAPPCNLDFSNERRLKLEHYTNTIDFHLNMIEGKSTNPKDKNVRSIMSILGTTLSVNTISVQVAGMIKNNSSNMFFHPHLLSINNNIVADINTLTIRPKKPCDHLIGSVSNSIIIDNDDINGDLNYEQQEIDSVLESASGDSFNNLKFILGSTIYPKTRGVYIILACNPLHFTNFLRDNLDTQVYCLDSNALSKKPTTDDLINCRDKKLFLTCGDVLQVHNDYMDKCLNIMPTFSGLKSVGNLFLNFSTIIVTSVMPEICDQYRKNVVVATVNDHAFFGIGNPKDTLGLFIRYAHDTSVRRVIKPNSSLPLPISAVATKKKQDNKLNVKNGKNKEQKGESPYKYLFKDFLSRRSEFIPEDQYDENKQYYDNKFNVTSYKCKGGLLKKASNSTGDVLVNFNIYLKDTNHDDDELLDSDDLGNVSTVGRLLSAYKQYFTRSTSQVFRNGKRVYLYYCLITYDYDGDEIQELEIND